jgi:uncharacterized protein
MDEMQTLLLVTVLGLIGGFYGTSVGGAGLIIVPMMIFLGLPAQEAVATTVFSYIGMMIVGLYTFHHADKIDYRIGSISAVISVLGAVIGSFILLSLSHDILTKIIGFSIIISLILLPLKGYGIHSRQMNQSMRTLGYFLMLLLGIISGFVAGGIAIFASYILIFCFGQTFVEAAATRKVIFLPRTLVLVGIFGYTGLIYWQYGIPMLLAEGVGAYLGTHFALKKGNSWVRILFIVVAAVLGIKLLI